MQPATDALFDILQQLGNVPRPMHDYSTANFNDAMERIGIGDRVLDEGLRPLLPYTKLVGTAVTLKLEAAESGGSYIEEYADAFEAGKLTPSPVLVIESPPGTSGAMGSGGAYILRRHYGFVGCIVDGVLRDTDDLRTMGFQSYYRAISPRFKFGTLKGVSANEPVLVGGVLVSPGDIIVGDNDGIVAVPRHDIARVIEAMNVDLDRELKILQAIDSGVSYRDCLKLPSLAGDKGNI